jgi:hypothetical protein
MRVLFLDFDGVLHAGPKVEAATAHWCWLPALSQLLARHEDVRIVVHSTWRYDYNVEELRELVGRLGDRVVGATPAGGRLESIEAWLADHPGVSTFRILDDAEREFYRLPEELILCDPALGITDPAARKLLLDWLERSSPQL